MGTNKPNNQDQLLTLIRLCFGLILGMFGLFIALKIGLQDQPISGVFAGMVTGLVSLFLINKD